MALPLPLTAFEEYILLDGTPAHPMQFFYRLRFDGPIDPGQLRAAAAAALERHPLLAARIERRHGHRPRFAARAPEPGGRDCVLPLDVEPGDDLPAIPPLDERTGPLVRLVSVGPTGEAGLHDVIAQFHHVACDGLGALAFLADLLEILDARLTGRPASLDALEPRLLSRRGRYGLDSWHLLASLPSQARGLEGVWKFMRHRPVRIAAPPGTAGLESRPEILAARSVTFTADEAAALRKHASRSGVSLNELAAAALLEALAPAVPVATLAEPRSVIRLSIPINMRQAADRRVPAANIVSMVFLDRGAAQIAAAARLPGSLHDEMHLIKRLGLGMTFLFTLAAARCSAGGIASLVRNQSTAATALFTNLGRVFRRHDRRAGRRTAARRSAHLQVGDARLERVEGLAPLRRGTTIAVAATEYAGTLCFTLRHDPMAVTAAAATRIGDDFATRLRCRMDTLSDASAAEADEPLLEAVR
jgi:hypothetical protein